MSTPVTIRANIMWAYLNKQNPLSNKYSVDLTNLSDAATKALEGLGLKVSFKEDKGHYIVCKSRRPIQVYNAEGDEIPGDVVGNGSKARAVVGFYDWQFSGKSGKSPSLAKLVIDELEVYEGETGAVEVSEEAL